MYSFKCHEHIPRKTMPWAPRHILKESTSSSVLSNHSGITVYVSNRKKTPGLPERKCINVLISNTWKLNNTFPNNHCVKDEVVMESKN
jgi:hypothetical protein